MTVTVRQATVDDEADVVSFTRDTWPDHGEDYIQRVFGDWIATDDDTRRTFVAEVDGSAVGLVRAVLLSGHEAWMQGMRVAPPIRGRGLSARLHDAAAAWARTHGATVARSMVFSWNAPALAASRAAGFTPVTAFRWAYLTPDGAVGPTPATGSDPDAAWTAWWHSPARDHLDDLVLSMEEAWALQELTVETLERAAAETALFVVQNGGPGGMSFRSRTVERETADGQVEHLAEYGVAAWTGPETCEGLVDAIARDAAAVDADRARVLVPETVGAVSDVALAGAALDDSPDYVFEADLT